MGTPPDPFGLVGQVLDAQYRVERVAGEGGFSVVYKGFHLGLGEPIAIKCLKLQASYGSAVVESFMSRFRDEGKILYRLSQGNLHIVRSIAGGIALSPTTRGLVPYTVLEWLDGRSLAEDLDERRAKGARGRSLRETIDLLDSAIEAVGHAHALGVVHRDLNPGNIFLAHTRDGVRAKVLDFGVAKVISDHAMALGPRAATYGHMRIFSPAYAAPEQFEARVGKIAPETDVYTLALVLVEVLTGAPANRGADLSALIEQTLDPERRPTPRALGVELGDAVEDVFARALSVSPAARPRDASELWSMLRHAMTTRHTAPPPSRDTDEIDLANLPRPEPRGSAPQMRADAHGFAPEAAAADGYQPGSTLRMSPQDHLRAHRDPPRPTPPADVDALAPVRPLGRELPSTPGFGPVPTLWQPAPNAPHPPLTSQPAQPPQPAPPEAQSAPTMPPSALGPAQALPRAKGGMFFAAALGALLALVGLGVIAQQLHLLPGFTRGRLETDPAVEGTTFAGGPTAPPATSRVAAMDDSADAAPAALASGAGPAATAAPSSIAPAAAPGGATPVAAFPPGQATAPAPLPTPPQLPASGRSPSSGAPPARPGAGTRAFNPAVAEARLRTIDAILASCRKADGRGGNGSVHVVFANDGRVTSAHVAPPFTGTPEGDCAEARFGTARTDPFEGPPGALDHRFRIPK